MACTLQLAVVVDRYALSLAAGAVDVKPNASKVIGNKSGEKMRKARGSIPPPPPYGDSHCLAEAVFPPGGGLRFLFSQT